MNPAASQAFAGSHVVFLLLVTWTEWGLSRELLDKPNSVVDNRFFVTVVGLPLRVRAGPVDR